MTSLFHNFQGILINQEKSWVTAAAPSSSSRMHEQSVYHRFLESGGEGSDCVLRCLEILPGQTPLEYMVNGDSRSYIKIHRPTREVQLGWFPQMASALDLLHERRVLVADIATRNIPVDADLALKICDLSEASILLLDSDMSTADDDSHTVRVDVGLFAGIMYEIITGPKYGDNL
ncbi:hypothetical protein BDV19DRAFT_357955 [Aspergillus venezuelensis]